MPKISITLPNVTEISMEADNPSELHQIVAMVKSDLLHELVRLPQPGAQGQDVPDAKNEEVPSPPDKNISVPSNGSSQTLDTKPLSSGKDQNGVAAPETASKGSPEEPQRSPLPSERSTTRRDTPPADPSPGAAANPKPRPPVSGTSSNSSIPAELSDPRLGHDFAVFCRTVNPIGDMRKVVVAAEGAARHFSMKNVDAWELGHLFEIAGWAQPHSFPQALRNAARSKFRWLERVPGRAGRYSVTDEGRELVLKGTNLL